MAPRIRWLDDSIFEAPPLAAGARSSGRAAARIATEPPIETPPFLRQAEDVLQPVAVRRRLLRDDAVRDAAARPEVALQVEAKPGEEYLLIVKHPSGALSFHRGTDVAPTPTPRRGQRKKAPRKSKAK